MPSDGEWMGGCLAIAVRTDSPDAVANVRFGQGAEPIGASNARLLARRLLHFGADVSVTSVSAIRRASCSVDGIVPTAAFVLDSSVALTWCFEDERTATTDALLERVTDAGLRSVAVATRSAQRLGDRGAPRACGCAAAASHDQALARSAHHHRFRDGPECLAAYLALGGAFSIDRVRRRISGTGPANEPASGLPRPRAPDREHHPRCSPPGPPVNVPLREIM